LAIIRPAKRYLIGKDWNTVLAEVWQKPRHSHEYYFKKSHATAYAVAVVVQMNLI
jgi:transposase